MAADVEKRGGLDASVLKIIAIIGMTCDHIGIVFSDQLDLISKTLLYLPGGLTFPIMAYLLIEGYRKTSNVKRYMLRLFLFGLVALVPFAWALYSSFNVMITLLAGLVVLFLYDRMKNRFLFWVVFTAITGFTVLCDWSLIGVPLVLAMYVIKGEKKRIALPICCLSGVMLIIYASVGLIPGLLTSTPVNLDILPDMAFMVGCLFVIPLLFRYNGRRGLDMKYFFYAYYPAHLAVLALIRGLLFGIWW